MPISTTTQPKTAWFQDARFGLFIHWGLYAIPGGEWQGQTMDYVGEWIQSKFRIPNTEYGKLAAGFNPVKFDADEWVSLARQAGMRYLVFTAKHHDGFALYGSKVDAYNIVDATPYGRDPLAELAAACAKQGMRLGLYYSQDLDWRHPDAGDPGPDFPSNYGMSWGNDWDYPDTAAKNFKKYFNEKSLPQVTELLSNYGPISLMWFDCPMTMDVEDSHRLMKVVQELQPGCLVNSRVGNGYGDFLSLGDNQVPVNKVRGIWECAATLNDTWGFKHSDHNWKSGLDTLAILIGLASRGVNYLLNIGPQPDGALPTPSVEVLGSLGQWMQANSAAIHGTQQSPFAAEFSWGWVTARAANEQSGARLYLIFNSVPTGQFLLRGLNSQVIALKAQAEKPLGFSQSEEDGYPVLHIDFSGAILPQPFPVVTLELEGELDIHPALLPQFGGEINLAAGQGVFVKNEAAETTEQEAHADFVGPAGEITRVQSEPSFSASGYVVDWLSASHQMQWEFVILAAGKYEVEVTSCSPHHNMPWEGGHRVQLEIDGQIIDATLQADEPVETPDTVHYAKAISRLGGIEIETAGVHQAVLRAVEIQSESGVGLSLVQVQLRLVSETNAG